jgi:hypothetical protein
MSDYLNNLVARALNMTPVVQPRLTSLFEPSAEGFLAHSFEHGTVRESLTARELTHQASPASVEQAPAPLSQPRTPISIEPGEGEVGPRPRSRFESFEHHEEYKEAESKEQFLPRAASLVQAPLLSWATAVPSAPPASNVAIGSLTQPSLVEQNAQTSSAQRQTSASDISARLEPAPAQPLRPSTPAIIVRQPDSPPIMPTGRVMKQTAEAAEPPQTISVTIGRVDVRAVFPQPPASRVSRTEKPAAMSLDEYLKRRSEARR